MALKCNPEEDSKGGGDFHKMTAGRKLVHGVGLNRYSANTGTSMISLGFVVLRDATKSGDQGELHMEKMAVTQKALFRIAKWADATGWKREFDAESDDDILKILAMGPVVAVLEESEYNGKTTLQVKEWARYSGNSSPEWEGMVSAGKAKYQEIQKKMEAKRSGGGGGGSSYGGGSGGGGGYSGGGPQDDVDDVPF